MILDAARMMGVNPLCCVVIGDKLSDVQAAHNAGASAIFIDHAHSIADAIESILTSN